MRALQACCFATPIVVLLWLSGASGQGNLSRRSSAQGGDPGDVVTCAPVERSLRYERANDMLVGAALGLSDGVGTTAAQRSRASAMAHRRARGLVHEALDAQLAHRNASPARAARLHDVVDHWKGPRTVRDLGDGSVVACVAFPVADLRRACGEASEWLWQR